MFGDSLIWADIGELLHSNRKCASFSSMGVREHAHDFGTLDVELLSFLHLQARKRREKVRAVYKQIQTHCGVNLLAYRLQRQCQEQQLI